MELSLELHAVSKRYGKTAALKEVSCRLTPGIYGLLGPNGAGKTTLIHLLTTVLEPSQGNILFQGTDVRQWGQAYLRQIGYSPQHPGFYPNFTVLELMRYLCALKELPRRTSEEAIGWALELTHLTAERSKRIDALSGGMKQRLSIAQAVLGDPGILVLDEPTAGLDPAERGQFRKIISSISGGKIVLISTHIISDVEFLASKLLILREGRLLCQAALPELLGQVEGKVWAIQAAPAEAEALSRRFLTVNVKPSGTQTELRVLCEHPPCQDAVLVPPQLEDALLSVFGKGEEKL